MDTNSNRTELDSALRQLDAIKNSTSWKITKPIRVLGNFYQSARNNTRGAISAAWWKLLARLSREHRTYVSNSVESLALILGLAPNPWVERALRDRSIEIRRLATQLRYSYHLLTDNECPIVDVCVVTFNNSQFLKRFLDSLIKCDYPLNNIRLFVIDNTSNDHHYKIIVETLSQYKNLLEHISWKQEQNSGFGSGQNTAINQGAAEYILVSNIDLEFMPGSLRQAVSDAVNSDKSVATWEFRQKPFEHPKIYDPVSSTTRWNSHACVLLRRVAYRQIAGYDPNIFMYGEDVDLSLQFAKAGYFLKYCPRAVVWHDTYINGRIKPIQYRESIFANAYLRLKYGTIIDIIAIAALFVRVLGGNEQYPGSRQDVVKAIKKVRSIMPKMIFNRILNYSSGAPVVSFRGWDYELTRLGSDVGSPRSLGTSPLVSVVTRTTGQRLEMLTQAIISVANQSYDNIEHIIVEDGSTIAQSTVNELQHSLGRSITYYSIDKAGRCVAGNHGINTAKGLYCLFLDDDDLMYADHIEALVSGLDNKQTNTITYSLAWEVATWDDGVTYTEEGLAMSLETCNDAHLRLPSSNPFAIQSVLFPKEVFQVAGGFDTRFEYLEDWILWNKMSAYARFVQIPKVTSIYRVPADNKLREARQKVFNNFYPRALAFINTLSVS